MFIGIEAGSNNHGCRDYLVAAQLTETTAMVVEVASCDSCWQVGHDIDHVFADVGDVIEVEGIVPAGDDWAVDVGMRADSFRVIGHVDEEGDQTMY